MTVEDDRLKDGKKRAFAPFLAPNERQRLHALLSLSGEAPQSFVDELRALARRYIDDGDSLKLRTVCLLVADLCELGWQIDVDSDTIHFEPPGISRSDVQSVDDVKERVRKSLQGARLRQLQEPSVRKFLHRVEARTLRQGIKASILDLIDDGAALARDLRRVNALPESERDAALKTVIDPVVEVCDATTRCADTGLPLNEIWRYFRHTWAHEYRAIPGRQMFVLVRNRARPKRPIMGIAMLASPVMRLTARDNWIGWLRDALESHVVAGTFDANDLALSMMDRVDESIASIRWDDLASDDEIRSPTDNVILRLGQKAAGAAFAREQQLKTFYTDQLAEGDIQRPHRGELTWASPDANWLKASDDLLFVRKRAEGMSNLLFAKQVLGSVNFSVSPIDALKGLFGTRNGQRAIDIALTEFRKAGLSSQVADVSICGAVHPYNTLLSGKLVALMLTSREVRDAYRTRYSGQVSVIASQMAGRAISKSAELRILTTTSLYGVGSSQYNRLVLNKKDHPGLPFDIRWGTIGKSLTGGFGTLHLSSETTHALRSMAIAKHDARRVNNRFGEGTSPRLRQIREGLDVLGLKSDEILHHANPRIFYGCELNPGARSSLLGLSGFVEGTPSSAAIADAWRHRWLARRGEREETLEDLTRFGPTSVRASLYADADGQFLLPLDL